MQLLKVFTFILFITSAKAQLNPTFHSLKLPLFEVGVGAINIDVPYYPGSLRNQNRTLPLFWPIYRGKYFRLDQEGTRAKLTNKELYEVGISAGFSFPVKNNDVDVREGMNDINYVVEIGPRIIYRIISDSSWQKLNFNLSIRSAFEINDKNLRSKNIGVSGGSNLSYWIYLNKDKSASLFTNIGILFGDKKYNDFYYGVSNRYETSSRLTFQAKEGEISKEFLVELPLVSIRTFSCSLVDFIQKLVVVEI